MTRLAVILSATAVLVAGVAGDYDYVGCVAADAKYFTPAYTSCDAYCQDKAYAVTAAGCHCTTEEPVYTMAPDTDCPGEGYYKLYKSKGDDYEAEYMYADEDEKPAAKAPYKAYKYYEDCDEEEEYEDDEEEEDCDEEEYEEEEEDMYNETEMYLKKTYDHKEPGYRHYYSSSSAYEDETTTVYAEMYETETVYAENYAAASSYDSYTTSAYADRSSSTHAKPEYTPAAAPYPSEAAPYSSDAALTQAAAYPPMDKPYVIAGAAQAFPALAAVVGAVFVGLM